MRPFIHAAARVTRAPAPRAHARGAAESSYTASYFT